MIMANLRRLAGLALLSSVLAPPPCAAQEPAPAAAAPPADIPSIKVGVLLFADYTIQQQPAIQDADGNEVTLSSFNISRSYLNVTGNITRKISFRVTPDIFRETGVGSALNGSYTFRLKYAYAEWNLSDHVGNGAFARFGMQPTPWVEFIDAIYRYRFQGATFEDREGFLPSSDTGATFHYSLPGHYGDLQAAVFNGETFARQELNDQKSVQVRGTLRPAPGRGALDGLRVTGFYDKDAYVKHADRRRAIVGLTFEHPHVHAAFTYLDARDQTSATRAAINARAWSAWVTPRTARGWEGLLRFDHQQPNTAVAAQRKDRLVAGGAYWFPHQGNVATALMLDVDQVKYEAFSPVRPTERRIGVHALVSF